MAVAAVVNRNRQRTEAAGMATGSGMGNAMNQAMMIRGRQATQNSFISAEVASLHQPSNVGRVGGHQDHRHMPGSAAVGPGAGIASGRRRVSAMNFGTTGKNVEKDPDDDDDGYADELPMRDLIYFLWDGFPSPKFSTLYPRWWTASDILGKVNFFFVIASCISFATETLPTFYKRDLLAFEVIEWVCILFFTVDILTRVILTRSKLNFLKSPQNWVDVVSILPFYIGFFTDGDDSAGASGLIMFRTLRLMRILRVLKLSKHNIGLEAVLEALSESSEAISLLGFLLIIALVLFSSAMFFAEQTVSHYDDARGLWIRSDGRVSPYQSIFHSMWWCIVTITTVGYGDAVPISALGKILAGFTMICGVFVIAFPTVILSTNFQEIHQAKVEAQRQLLEELAMQRDQVLQRQEDAKREKADRQRDTDGPILLSGGSSSNPKQQQQQLEEQQQKQKQQQEGGRLGQHDDEEMTTVPLRDPPGGSGSGVMPRGGGGGSGSALFNIASEEEKPTSFMYRFFPPGSAEILVNPNTASKYTEEEILHQQEFHEIVVVNEELAIFEPAIHLQCTKENQLHARVEQFGEQTIVTLQLLLESGECLDAAQAALRENRPGEEDTIALVCRPISRIAVDLFTVHPSLQGIRLMTSHFTEPVGAVPLSVVVPSASSSGVKQFLANISAVNFTIRVEYDCPAALDEPLIHYGGIVLGTTSYDEEEEDAEQAVLVERTIGRQSVM